MKIKIDQYELKDSTVYYVLDYCRNNEKHKFHVRYSQLLDQHEKFFEMNSNKMIPLFPAKKLFGNKKPKFINERMR